MKRIWLLLLLAVAWCSIASLVSLLTDDPQYLIWGVFLPPTLALLNVLRPRRGAHHIYWNRYIYIFGGLLLGLFAIPVVTGYLTLKYDLSMDIFGILFWSAMVILVPGFFLWFKFSFMPTWGPWRLRKRYPRMVAAARRLKRRTEHYTWYFPLLFVQGKPYLVVGYEIQGLTGIATLDEKGRFIQDETLAQLLIGCYKLAVAVLHMPDSRKRAADIDSFRKTDRQMHAAFQRFREDNREYFSVAGRKVNDLWKSISDFGTDFHAIFMTVVERRMWQSRWALEHGLNKLTEISDQQLREVEGYLAEFDKTLLNHREKIYQVATDAEVLQQILPKLPNPWVTATGKRVYLTHRTAIQDLLKSLIVLRSACAVWQPTVIDFLPREHEWKLWQRRKEMAERFDEKPAGIERRSAI